MEELGLPYKLEFKRGDLAGSMASIKAINPGMPVAPTVKYGDQVIVESGAIIETDSQPPRARASCSRRSTARTIRIT